MRRTILLSLSVVLLTTSTFAESWFQAFQRVPVPPVSRADVTQLIDGGVVETDGFSTLRLSLGGEFKEGMPTNGVIGALLVPDMEPFTYLLQSEGELLFAIEVSLDLSSFRRGDGAIFVSPTQEAKIAFPAYRVYFFNETGSGAEVGLFAYKTR